MQVLDPEKQIVPRGANVEIAMTRAAQEVQAAMAVAKRFPRDEVAALDKIKVACKSLRLAEDSQYEYARGGTEIVGPSIRLLEAIAQRWGNCEGGVIELDRTEGKSIAMSYAVDLESNHREVRIFEVEHVRDTRKGSYKVTDNRDIYEMVANQGSRRRRACYQAVIPTDVVDEAIEECNKTLKGDSKDPLSVRIQKMVEAFGQFSVTPEMITRKMGCSLDAISYIKLAKLRRIYNSIKDGLGDVGDFFEVQTPEQPVGKQSFGFKKQGEKAKEGGEEKKSETKPTEETSKTESPAGETLEKATVKAEEQAHSSAPPAGDIPSEAEQEAIRRQEQAEASQHHADQPKSGTSQTPFSPTTSTAPRQPAPDPPGDLVKEVTRLGKEKGVNMFDLSGFATKQYGHSLIKCSTLELQSILAKLREHPQGERLK